MVKQLPGIIHVTGEHDTGKTLFALQCGAKAERILLFDDDVKGRGTIAGIPGFKPGRNYVDLAELGRGKKEIETHDAVMAIINGVQPNEYDAIIFDTWTHFASTCVAKVMANPSAYRQFYSPKGDIKGAEWRIEGKRLEAQILDGLASKAQTVIVVTHLKDHYINNARTGKQVPASTDVLERVPTFRVWLRRNPSGSPVPVGLVLKRISKTSETGHGLRTVNILPQKVVPGPQDGSLWDTIWHYWDNPIDLRAPHPDEIPDEFELSIIEGTLTKDQRRLFEAMLEAGVVEKAEPTEVQGVLIAPEPKQLDSEKVKALLTSGKSPAEIAAELGASVADVLRAM